MLGGCFGMCCVFVSRGRVAPAGEVLFFASPKKSTQKKGDPAVRVPPLRYGQPAMLGRGCCRRTHCALTRSVQTCCGKSEHEVRVSFGTRTHPACASRHAQKGVGDDPGHRCARPWLGERSAQREARACRAERSNGPCADSTPAVRAAGRLRGAHACRRTRMLRALTRRGCPNGALPARSEFCGGTPQAPRRRSARSDSVGVADWGSPFFAYFLWRSKRK